MQTLYQINVETRDGRIVPVCPKMDRVSCERIIVEVNKQISKGAEKMWSNPHIVAVL